MSMPDSSARESSRATLYRRIWRWHFYAGVCVLPFVALLALSGSVFLFKPQIDRWEERPFRGLPASPAALPSQQVAAALAAHPSSLFRAYRLPEAQGDAALVSLQPPAGGSEIEVFVSPGGEVLGSLVTDRRVVEVARRLHGKLLLGRVGGWLVELVACWAIVMLATGFVLWWPRGRGLAGVLWPRRASMLRDLHAVTGFWVSAFALVLLLTGLPWTQVWGSAFRTVRAEFGWVRGAPQWTTGTEHHHGTPKARAPVVPLADGPFDRIIGFAAAEPLHFPTRLLAPGTPLFGRASPDWQLVSLVQNRPLGLSIVYHRDTGLELHRERFADRHPIDRVIGYGQAWHEGALFGPVNQLIGVLTAAALVALCVTGLLMWWRRRPQGRLGAPSLPASRRIAPAAATFAVILVLLLPLLAGSLLFFLLLDALLPRLCPRAAVWLGISPARPN